MPEPKLNGVPCIADRFVEILVLSVEAWDQVFPLLEWAIPDYVFDAFCPHGWQARQRADISAICQDGGTSVWLALIEGEVAGFIGVRVYHEDSMGEIHVAAVDAEMTTAFT